MLVDCIILQVVLFHDVMLLRIPFGDHPLKLQRHRED